MFDKWDVNRIVKKKKLKVTDSVNIDYFIDVAIKYFGEMHYSPKQIKEQLKDIKYIYMGNEEDDFEKMAVNNYNEDLDIIIEAYSDEILFDKY